MGCGGIIQILFGNLVNYNLVEDAAMGSYFNGILGAPMLPNRICFFEDITDKVFIIFAFFGGNKEINRIHVRGFPFKRIIPRGFI